MQRRMTLCGSDAVRLLFVVAAMTALASLATTLCLAQPDSPPPIRLVRVGVGNLEGLKNSITLSQDACRIAKHLPPGPPTLPPDSLLAKFAIAEQEELFDGQHWALYVTQRQIAAEASNGCQLAVFLYRDATVELTCVSRVRGSTSTLAELMDFEAPSTSQPEIFEQALPASPCQQKQRIQDLQGLPRVDAGMARCVWSSSIVARQMAALAAKLGIANSPSRPNAGNFDTCVYEDRPTYYFQGTGRPVILMTHTESNTPGASVLESTLGETAAFGNLSLHYFSAGKPIDGDRFNRAAVSAFLSQTTKNTVE